MDIKYIKDRLKQIDIQLNNLGLGMPFTELNNIIKSNKDSKPEQVKRKKSTSFHKEFLNIVERYLDKIPDSEGSKFYNKLNIKIGIICDEFLYNLYKDSAEVIYITQENYRRYIGQINIMIIASTWVGLDKQWYGLGNKSKNNELRHKLYLIMEEFRNTGAKIVFYSKEDPLHYERFLDIAQKSDYIFTTMIEKIEDYKRDCNNNNVYLLEFGINPIYHNPIGSRIHKLNRNIIFSGSWNDVHIKRCQNLQNLLDKIIDSELDLTIIDRNSATKDERFKYPLEYNNYLYNSIDHNKLQKVHKLFDWALNISTITDSMTMTANRVYELQAIGNLMISNYSVAINNKFPTVFTQINEHNEINSIFNSYTEEEIYELQMQGLRNVMSNHTVYHRLYELLKSLGFEIVDNNSKKVAVIADKLTDEILHDFSEQTYPYKDIFDKETISKENLLDYDMITFFNHKYKYEEFYLEDMINAFKYTNCDYITKDSYKQGKDIIKGVEHSYVDVMKDKYKTVFWKDVFNIDNLLNTEGKISLKNGYSVDRLEFNEIRKAEKDTSFYLAKFSIIVPIYNNGKHLFGKCFMSLRRSSMFNNMEIVLVDDGSTDNYTPKIVRRLERHYPNVISYCYNDGGSGSASRPRNKGLEVASTEYIGYLDPDNEAINDGFARLYNEIIQTDVDAIFSKFYKISDSIIDFKFKKFGLIDNPKQQLIDDNLSMQSIQTMLVRRDFIIKNSISQVLGALGQDKLFYFEIILNSKKVLRVDIPIHYYYANTSGSVTNSIEKKFFEKSYMIEAATLEVFRKHDVLNHYLKSRFEIFYEGWFIEKLSKVKLSEFKDCINIMLSIYELYENEVEYKFKKIRNQRFINFAKQRDYESIIKEYAKKERKKIVFAGHDFKFLTEIIKRFKQNIFYEVRIDRWKNHTTHNEKYSKECLEWADVIFCEWGLGNAVWYSQKKKPHQKLFIRMHRQEIDLPYYLNFNFDNINSFLTISPAYYEKFKNKMGIPENKITMIYNYIDTQKLGGNLSSYSAGRRYNIGMMGYLPKMKRLDSAIDIIEKLYEKDKKFTLYIKGKKPQELKWLWSRKEEREYYEKLFKRINNSKAKGNIIFEDFSPDVENWFGKIGFMLSTSDFESFHLAPMEGLAAGAYPVVRNWEGSDAVYPSEVIFRTIDEMVEFILHPNLNIDELVQHTGKFDIEIIFNEIYDLIDRN